MPSDPIGRLGKAAEELSDDAAGRVLLRAWVERQDAQSYREFVDRYQRLLHGVIARRLAGAPHLLNDVEDVVQDVFIYLQRRGALLLNRPMPLHGQLTRLALGRAISYYRSMRYKPRPHGGFEDCSDPLAQLAIRPPDTDTVYHLALRNCLDRMPTNQLLLIHLRYWEDQKQIEMAADVGIKSAAMSLRLANARAWLLDCIHRKIGLTFVDASGGQS